MDPRLRGDDTSRRIAKQQNCHPGLDPVNKVLRSSSMPFLKYFLFRQHN